MKPHDMEFSYRFNQEHRNSLIQDAEQARQATQLNRSPKRRIILWSVCVNIVKRISIRRRAVKPSPDNRSHHIDLDYVTHEG